MVSILELLDDHDGAFARQSDPFPALNWTAREPQ
jgi:hypothetical protein